jgi:hypothetical protein
MHLNHLTLILACIVLAFVATTSANSISAASSTLKVGTLSNPIKYKVWGQTISSACPIGLYYFGISSPGNAYIRYDYNTVATVAYSTATSVGASLASSSLFNFIIPVTASLNCVIGVSVGSNAGTVTLSTLETLFDNNRNMQIIGGSYVSGTSVIKTGTVGGSYEAENVVVHPTCPIGDYTFNATYIGSIVKLYRSGTGYMSGVLYIWETTIGSNLDTAYNFWWSTKVFDNLGSWPCYIAIKVGKTASGTMNLAGVQDLFDGVKTLTITNA